MAPQVRALAQSESKAKFMARLGLDERNDQHRQLYHMMKVGRSVASDPTAIVDRIADNVPKEKASSGRKRMMTMPNVLRDGSEQSVQPPFSNAQLNETATHREILNIYQHARPETRVFYDMGRDIDGLEEENWVIRWLLWHVFRYRDNRNKNRRQGSPGPRSPSGSDQSSSETHLPASNGSIGSTPVAKAYYDPVRDT